MGEAAHFRDFLDPIVDAVGLEILDPKPGPLQTVLANRGHLALEAIGGEKVRDDFDGQSWRFRDEEGRQTTLDIREPSIVIPALIKHRDLGLFYTYTGKEEPLWVPDPEATTTDPHLNIGHPMSDSVVAAGEVLYRQSALPRRIGRLAATIVAPLRDIVARQQWEASTDRTKEEIHAHYDVRPEVYHGEHGFLGPYLQYSSGLLPAGQEFTSLEDLEIRKIDSLDQQLELDTAETFLEVGGGWGALSVELAKRYPHLQVKSLTVSAEQLLYARALAEAEGVADRVEFVGEDYRDLRGERFDRVVSVEMIEAVDWRDLDIYFDALTGFVDPQHGIIVLQSINIKPDQYALHRHNQSFANVAIFPGGSIVPFEAIEDGMAARGWDLRQKTDLTSAYVLTLREWRRNVYEHIDGLTEQWLKEGIDQAQIDRFRRGWADLYLGWSGLGFSHRVGHLEDWQSKFVPRRELY